MKWAYYNEFDSEAASLIQVMIDLGYAAPGEIDTRPIQEVKPEDVKPFLQRNFFAGLGGWSYALKLAGWPDDVPVTTASPPCQGFSCAGKQKGKKDERHLWPIFFNLFRESPTDFLFGEQVEKAIAKQWFDGESDSVATCLQSEDYAVGMAVLSAGCAGAPHKRDRIYFGAVKTGHVADSANKRGNGRGSVEYNGSRRLQQPFGGSDGLCGVTGDSSSVRSQIAPFTGSFSKNVKDQSQKKSVGFKGTSRAGDVGDSESERRQEGRESSSGPEKRLADAGATSDVGDSEGRGRRVFQSEDERTAGRKIDAFTDSSADSDGTASDSSLADADRERLQGQRTDGNSEGRQGSDLSTAGLRDGARNPWAGCDWLLCPDGKARAVKPGIRLLVDGLPAKPRRTLLKAFGNAIVAPLAAEFIEAFVGAVQDAEAVPEFLR